MQSATQADTPRATKKMLWTGRVISALPVLMLVFSGTMKLVKPHQVVEGFNHLGWPDRLALGLGVVEIACAVIYVIPRTFILGAILMTGYLGGATATHVRIGESGNAVVPVILGVLAWLGLYLRDPRLRALVPLRKLVTDS